VTKSNIEVVNIVAVGELSSEVDIEQVANDSNLAVSNFDPRLNATFLRFNEDGELIVLYTSGKYAIRGGDEFDNLYRVNDQFLSRLNELGLEFDDCPLEIKNVVAVGDLEKEINLNTLMIGLGLEQAEYEPEQFPGLVYRPTKSRCVLLVFASGKVVITAGRTQEEDQKAFDHLKNKVKEFL